MYSRSWLLFSQKANDPFILYYFGAILIRYGDLERAKRKSIIEGKDISLLFFSPIEVLEKSKLCGGTCGNSSLDQCYVPAVFELGCLYSRLNCLDKASENFESIVAQEPDNGVSKRRYCPKECQSLSYMSTDLVGLERLSFSMTRNESSLLPQAALVQLADCLERQCQFDDAYEILQRFEKS